MLTLDQALEVFAVARREGRDPYVAVASARLGVPASQVSSKQRDSEKRNLYAALYGTDGSELRKRLAEKRTALTDAELHRTLCDPAYVTPSPRHDLVQDAFDRLIRERDAAWLRVESLTEESKELRDELRAEAADRVRKLRNDAIGAGASAVVLSAVTWALLFVPAAAGHSWGMVGLTALLVAMPNVFLGMSLAYLGLWARGGR